MQGEQVRFYHKCSRKTLLGGGSSKDRMLSDFILRGQQLSLKAWQWDLGDRMMAR